ncbi:unnamed protein product [Protopolystoma xenopodis]|uniref:Uncharacterized protein n=1 Tax=Protopolystoma xenopodis TaxID=117903 RepID=A0A3S5CGY8_9PLAT|nr:unnamed protein product [Protopolystoma xenopodis]
MLVHLSDRGKTLECRIGNGQEFVNSYLPNISSVIDVLFIEKVTLGLEKPPGLVEHPDEESEMIEGTVSTFVCSAAAINPKNAVYRLESSPFTFPRREWPVLLRRPPDLTASTTQLNPDGGRDSRQANLQVSVTSSLLLKALSTCTASVIERGG